VTLLGRSRLESLILPLGVKSAVPGIRNATLDAKSFWLTAARRACLADRIAGILHPATRVEAFTAGLLQDMAIPVMIDLKKNEYSRTFEQWNRTRDIRLDQAEKQAHGFDHQDVGALMAGEWNLPEYLVRSIRFHHADGTGQDTAEPAVRMVSQIHYAGKTEEPAIVEAVSALLSDKLAMSGGTAEKLVKEAFHQADEFASLIH
jgi:HD-like signal output (HDOD) protein